MSICQFEQQSISQFYLNYRQREYLRDAMSKVSRTFAIVTPYFEEPLDTLMSAAYLIFRVADNIEDCQQPYKEKQHLFAQFQQLLNKPTLATDILQDWSQKNWAGLDADQQELMQPNEGLMLWQIYELMPEQARSTIRRWVLSMVDGIETMLNPHNAYLAPLENILILATVEDYNRYCYFVAGTVGHMGTELAAAHYQLNQNETNRLLINCESCGNALQKINIIKDFTKDLAAGYCYLPKEWMDEIGGLPLALQGAPRAWTRKVILDALNELNQSVSYVLELPYRAVGYRLASLMCLLPAYQTLLLAAQRHQQLFTPDHQIKISRQSLKECIEDSKRMVHDNYALQQNIAVLQQNIDAALASV